MFKRIKYRYLVIKFEGNKEKTKREILRIFKEMYGKYGLAEANIKFIDEFEPIVLKINNKYVDKLRASIALLDIPLRTIGVSGSIKGVKKWI